MNQQFFNPGMMYTTAAPQINKPRMNNPLTDEEIKALQNQVNDEFNLSLDVKDLGLAFCTHKDPQKGTYSIIDNHDGSVTCTRCHQTFYPDRCTEEVVTNAVNDINNVLQTLKFLGVDLSDEVIRGYFGFLPYINKIPQLYRIVNASFNRYNPSTMFGDLKQETAANIFAGFNSMVNPGMPVYNAGPAMPNAYYNPQQAAMMGMQPQAANPFYGTPMPQQPMAQMPAAPAQPMAPMPTVPGQPEQVVIKEQIDL